MTPAKGAIWIPAACMAVLITLYALAPATKIDEVNYAALAPMRIWQQGGLHYYPLPVESAIFPQMPFQVSHLVFFAFHLPDAGAVVSALLGIALWILLWARFSKPRRIVCWEVWRRRFRRSASIRWSATRRMAATR
ncbi:MAG: hypothetical protein WDO73_36685 [Ignavibacteriota bacterium]